MANFVESAVLRLQDETSAPAKAANQALRQLWRTAKQLERISGPAKFNRDLLAAARTAQRMPQIVVRVDSSQVQRAISRLATLQRMAAQPLPGQRLPASGFGGGGGGRGGNVNMLGGQGPASATAGRIMARAFVAAIGFEIYGAVRRISAEAGRAILNEDSALGSLRQTGLDPAQVAAREAMAREVSNQFPELSRAQVLNSTRELANLALTTGDARTQMQNFGRTAVNLGTALGDMDKGAESARQLFRAGGLLGVSQDPVRQAAFIDEMQRAIIASGGDVQGAEIRRTLQQMRGQGLDLSPQAVGDLVSLRDEGGMMSTAEVRTFMNDLTRSNLNKGDLARQQKAGLRDAEGNTVGREGLLANPFEHVFDKIIPKLEALGVNLDDAAAVQKALSGKGGMGLTTSGAAFAQRVVSQRDQIAADRLQRARVNLTAALEDPTLRQRMARVQAQFDNASAEMTKSLKPVMANAMESVAGNLKVLADPNAGAAAKTAAGAASLATLLPVAIPAMLANLPQLLANPQTAPLATAGLALTGSAAALTGAASALAGAAVAQGGVDAKGLAGKGMGARLAALGLPAATIALLVGSTALLSNQEYSSDPRASSAGKRMVNEELIRQREEQFRKEFEAGRMTKEVFDEQLGVLERMRQTAKAIDNSLPKPSSTAAENDNGSPLSEAQRKLSDATAAATDIGALDNARKSLDQIEASFKARQKKIDALKDPLQKAAAQETIDAERTNLPAQREALRKREAEANKRLLDAYANTDIGAETKGEPEIVKRVRKLREDLKAAEAGMSGEGTSTMAPLPQRRPSDLPGEDQTTRTDIPFDLPGVVSQLGATFDAAKNGFAEVGPQIGEQAGQSFSRFGAEIGAAIGAQVRAAVSGIQVTGVLKKEPNLGGSNVGR